MRFDRYFDKISYYQSKAKGLSVFNSDEGVFSEFGGALSRSSIPHVSIRTSDLYGNNGFPDIGSFAFRHLVLFQDLDLADLRGIVEDLVNKLIFPTYYRNIPISFFSTLDRTAYSDIQIESSLIHDDYNEVIRLLLIEQINSLLSLVNFIFSTPAAIFANSENISYTPIELIFKDQLESKNISFTPQVKLGRFYADFVVEMNGKRLIVECDGKDYHNLHRDKERDKELSRQGMGILRLTGSEIYNDAAECVERVKRRLSQSPQSRAIDIDDDLDESQKASIGCITGPIRVLAPAGSGKTKTLTNRIVHLINSGIHDSQILALAFNKKAAEEMAERLSDKHVLVSRRLSDEGVAVRTFHSFGYEIVRDHLNWRFNGDEEIIQTRKFMEQSFREASIPVSIPNWKINDAIDKLLVALRITKMELPPLSEVTVELESQLVPFQAIFEKYLALQTRHNFLNFDDMIYLSLRILLKEKSTRQRLQNRFRYVLVDEFQDLNEAQLLTMQTLALPCNNLYIVGDDDQMIYGWRGAKISHILDFPGRYSESSDFTLSTNYRSSKRIVRHSGFLIEHNTNRTPKDINPKTDSEPGVLDVKLSENLHEQAIQAVNWIETQKQSQKADWRDFAALFRYHEYQFTIAMILDSRKIPHSPVNSQRLFARGPGKDIYAYLTVILHPHDSKPDDFSRILRRPNKYFTNDLISKAQDWDSFITLDEQSDLENWRRENIRNFINQAQALQIKLNAPLDTPVKLVSAIVDEFGFRKYYRDEAKIAAGIDEAGDDIIIEVIISVASAFESIDEFYSHVHKLVNDRHTAPNETDDRNSNEVLLATIHSCKGKEFENVVYFNLSNSSRARSESELEEERRVCYVGVTRAIRNVMITASEKGHSQFLPELLRNPVFKSLSTVRLSSLLSKTRMREEALLGRIKLLEKESEGIFDSFPELKGNDPGIGVPPKVLSHEHEIRYLRSRFPEMDGSDLQVKSPILKTAFMKLRLRGIQKARARIEKLEKEIGRKRTQQIHDRMEMVEQAARKIDELNGQIDEISERDLVACRDEIAEIGSEIEYRDLLAGGNGNAQPYTAESKVELAIVKTEQGNQKHGI